MVQHTSVAQAALYQVDETAWLEVTADLIRRGRFSEVDLNSLAEYLTDMAQRDRREVFSRLVVLLSHMLKWEHQPDHRSGSWRGTILEQQRELRQLLESGTLRNHAIAVFSNAYAEARKQAEASTRWQGLRPAFRVWTGGRSRLLRLVGVSDVQFQRSFRNRRGGCEACSSPRAGASRRPRVQAWRDGESVFESDSQVAALMECYRTTGQSREDLSAWVDVLDELMPMIKSSLLAAT